MWEIVALSLETERNAALLWVSVPGFAFAGWGMSSMPGFLGGKAVAYFSSITYISRWLIVLLWVVSPLEEGGSVDPA